MSPVVDTDKADIVDSSHVDAALASVRQNEENARRRAMVLTWGKAVLMGGLGAAAVIAALAFLMQPKVIEKPIIVYRDRPMPRIDTPLPPPKPAPTTETHPWDKLDGKEYVGIITDVINGEVCFDHSATNCTYVVKVGPDGHVIADGKGHSVRDPDRDFSPMVKWKGYSAYRAHMPDAPEDAANYWVADNGTLIHFEGAPTRKADAITLRSDGQSLSLDVGLGGRSLPFLLDTGASAMTVTQTLADQLVHEGHAIKGSPEAVVLADGSSRTVPTIIIAMVTVGAHRVGNVHAQVTPDGSPMLLGLGVLNAIGRFEVDAPHRTLTFTGGAA